MPLDPEFVGRSCRSAEQFEVTRGDIRRFADAIEDPSPMYRDPASARALGHPDVVAPPTFLIAMGGAGSDLLDLPGLGLDFARLVHGEQHFMLHRPVYAGDVLDSATTIADIRTAGMNEYMTLVTVVTGRGELIATLTNTIVSRGTAAPR